MANKTKQASLKDLDPSIYKDIQSINTLIGNTVLRVFKKYKELNKKNIYEFIKLPIDKTNVSSVMVYKKKNKYSCMIQVTNHVDTSKDMRKLMTEVFQKIRKLVRKKYKVELTSEYEKSKKYEGFDIWLNSSLSRKIWNSLDVEEENIKESYDVLLVEYNELPSGLKDTISDIYNKIDENFKSFKERYDIFDNTNISDETFGFTVLKKINDSYSGNINITSHNESYDDKLINMKNQAFQKIVSFNESFNIENPCKELSLSEDTDNSIEIKLSPEYSKKLYEYFDKDIKEKEEVVTEATNSSRMKSLEERGSNLLRSFYRDNPDKKVNDASMKLLSNIVTKNLIKAWNISFNEVRFSLDDKKKGTITFKLPQYNQEVIKRFIYGRESLNGFLHSKPSIDIKISGDIFNQKLENTKEFVKFIKNMLLYYEKNSSKYFNVFFQEVQKMDSRTKFLLCDKLSMIPKIVLAAIFIFDEVQISNSKTFTHNEKDIRVITNFIKNIFNDYKNPQNEQSKILQDLSDILLNLSKEVKNDKASSIKESIEMLYNGDFDNDINAFIERWEEEQVDRISMNKETNAELKYVTEKFGVKKLKKIPNDLIAYITIETDCIEDNNDKMMLASYTLGKIEIVEWYIQLLEVGSKKYVVQHTKPQLMRIHSQLLECYKNIMAVKIEKKNTDLIDKTKYPPGYEW
jgi:hypothetical protein|nr:MAG TPA: hypothetical protein [Caudoviricetes sp.]